MCGILGCFSIKNIPITKDFFGDMLNHLTHRGPDDEGIWQYENVILGHRRLSINDLSKAGQQPMLSYDKKWMIVCNGEIYNALEIKNDLLKTLSINFKSHSDTEVLINAIACFGIEHALQKCIGMFAFCAFYIPDKTLYLVRDRFGEKPLYYGYQNGLFSFSSELKALKKLHLCGWKFEIDRNALATYMRYSYIPAPYSIYEHIHKLMPGSILKITQEGSIAVSSYWDSLQATQQTPFIGSFDEAVFLGNQKIQESVMLQMRSDVPFGAFLSGGIDSSLVASVMQSQSSKPINTFSIGFYDRQLDEAHYAKKIATHLGTHHAEFYISEKEAQSVIPELSNIYDEPFADSSQIPTFILNRFAKEKVTVALSGDAGDELFAGYYRYFLSERIKNTFLKNPILRNLLIRTPTPIIKLSASLVKKYAQPYDRLLKLQQIIRNATKNPVNLYQQICSNIYNTRFVKNGREYTSPLLSEDCLNQFDSYTLWMMFVDSKIYLPDDILTKIDRASMAVSLETRVPFLDHRLYEFAWSLPMHYKMSQQEGKLILKSILKKYVPESLFQRPKMGFGIPLPAWLRGDLKQWANALLDKQVIEQQGYLDYQVIAQYWQEHQSGRRNWGAALWNILMFQTWMMGN